MHEETLRDLVDGGSSILGSLVKEFVVHNNQMDRMEKQKEMELELAEAQQRSRGTTTPDVAEPTDHSPPEGGLGLGAAIDDLKAREDCAMCQQLLDGIKAAPPDEQAVALTEYGEFRHMSRQGASEQELRRFLEGTEQLQAILEQQVAG